jgi:hypothetical protein
MLCRFILLVGLVGMVALPSLALAGDTELEVDWSLIPASSHRAVRITIKNTSAQDVEVQHPGNRCAIAFVVMDERGNLVQPVGVAKVDPRNATIKLKPGEVFEHALDQSSQLAHSKGLTLPFLTGTGLFAYDLKDGASYRVTVTYRPHGLASHGIASREHEWTGEHDKGKAPTTSSVPVHLGGERDREASFQSCYGIFATLKHSEDYYRFSKAGKEGVPKEKWFRMCYENLLAVKPGITRRELDKMLDMDGGICSPSLPRYCHRECPCLKINVKFDVKRNPDNQNRMVWSDDDKVLGVSRPYVETPFYD